MALEFSISVRGLKQIDQALRRLPDKLALRVVRKGTAAGARAIVAGCKRVAVTAFTQRTGAIVRNITWARGKKPTRYVGRYVIGVRHIASTRADQFGTASRTKAVGKIKQRRGLRKALADAGISQGDLGRLSGRGLARRGMNPYYYRFLELGTKSITARRFLQTGLKVAAQDAIRAAANRMRSEIGKLK